MAEVRINLDKYLEGQTTRPAVEARIRRIDQPARGDIKPYAIMIPAGSRSGFTEESFNLAPGNYLVEAYLPNGEVVTETVAVSGREDIAVELRGSYSPHEWLSWQHFNGYSPSRTAKRDRTARPTRLTVVTADFNLAPWLLDVWAGETPAMLPLRPANDLAPRPDGRHQPEFDPALHVTQYLYDSQEWNEGDRCYGLVEGRFVEVPVLAVMPMPWRQTAADGYANLDILLKVRRDDREWPVRASIVVRDNIMASVFGYLSSGDLPAARRVTDTAVNYLFEKVKNPIAAAGGAYILVRLPGAERGETPVWVPWLENLRNWFPWLPDGAILDGWAHLQGIGRTPDVAKATAAFIEAVFRGLPFYSSGVKLLYEGLTRINATLGDGPRSPDFEFAFEFVRRLALRVDVSQPFTVIRLT